FPPQPPSTSVLTHIVNSFCEALEPDNVMEEGCAVCGLLSLTKNMILLSDAKINI
ncbi:uncharacterized protein STEHIDRAFT_40328, partial [Stereum hirsutum FP-91666 SS1]